MKIKAVFTLFWLFLITACATVEGETPRYLKMNCSELEREIQVWHDQKFDGHVDETLGTIGVIFGDKKDQDEAESDMYFGEASVQEAKEHLKVLKQIRRSKGCRP